MVDPQIVVSTDAGEFPVRSPDTLFENLLVVLSSEVDVPHVDWVGADIRISGTQYPFSVGLALEGTDGPLHIRFGDDTELLASPDRAGTNPVPPDPWAQAIATGDAQRLVESIVTLAEQLQLIEVVAAEDRATTEALVRLLGAMSKEPDPPQGVVREAATWLWKKVDRFMDAAAETSGKAAGAAVVAGASCAIGSRFPDLAAKLQELIEITS